MLRTSALNYDLPAGAIATHPARPRDAAKLMVVHLNAAAGQGDPHAPQNVEHRTVRDLPDVLRAGDLLVLNSSPVLPARFMGVRSDSGGKVEGLYLGPAGQSSQADAPAAHPRWAVLLKSRRTKPGVVVNLYDRTGNQGGVSLRLVDRHQSGDEDSGGWIVEVLGAATDAEALARVGLTPLPPYIRQARKTLHEPTDDDLDRREYQTVFAHAESSESHGAGGSVAAPTAGLHFTPELLDRLHERGVRTAEVMLHVGIGTFKPVEAEFVEQHPMHSEWCRVPPETGRAIEQTRAAGGRVIAVGTTSARTLESFADRDSLANGAEGWTRILISPGHRWRWIDGLMTNFHLPRSTLLAMTAAMLGRDESAAAALLNLYREALARGYRFYSFGDAMVMLPDQPPGLAAVSPA